MSASGMVLVCSVRASATSRLNKCYPHILYPYNYDSFGRYSRLREIVTPSHSETDDTCLL